jgi:hypothetical protein
MELVPQFNSRCQAVGQKLARRAGETGHAQLHYDLSRKQRLGSLQSAVEPSPGFRYL